MNTHEEEIRPKHKGKRRKNPLTSQRGIVGEMAKIYRLVRRRKMDAEAGRSAIWMLERIGQRLEVIALEELHARIGELGAMANGQVINGFQEPDRQLIAQG